MKKTLRIAGLLLTAVLLGANLTACSSDDDETPGKNEEGVVVNQKKLTQIKKTTERDTRTWFIFYDSKGKVNSMKRIDNSNSSKNYKFTWEENTITEFYDNETNCIYSLTGGLTTTALRGNYGYSFAYNSFKQIERRQHHTEDDHPMFIDFTWENDKIIKFTRKDYSENEYKIKDETEFIYSGQTCKGYFPLATILIENDLHLYFAHPELIGMRTRQLPSKIIETTSYETTTMEFSYELDENGYLANCNYIEYRTYGSETLTKKINYTFKWE